MPFQILIMLFQFHMLITGPFGSDFLKIDEMFFSIVNIFPAMYKLVSLLLINNLLSYM